MQKETVPITNKTVSIVHTLSRRAAEQLSAKATQTKNNIASYILATIALVFIAVSTAMLVALQRSRSLSRPITQLALAANAFSSGTLDKDIEITGNLEIESLGHSFNSMRRQISRWQKALKEANNSLEERVKTRTHELQTATQQLEENAEHLRLSASVFKHSVEGIAIADTNGHILDANDAFCKIHGYTKQEVVGKSSRFFQSGRHDHDFFLTIWHSISKTGQWRGEIWNRRKDGSIFPLWMTINDVRDSDGIVTNYLGTFSDISQIKQSQEELDFLAHHDPLTELPNRLLLLERLAHAISRAKREKEQLAVIFLDLDRFKQINDSLGHPHGDKLLQQVAKRLSSEIRSDDTLARLGGDEFVLLLEGITKTESVGIAAQKLTNAFTAPFDIDDQEISITASLGIAIYPQDGIAPTVLLRNADTAMYSAKDLGRNNYQFYTQKLTEDAIERVAMENCLRNAIDNRELYLLYQPQIDLNSGKIIGVEALLRWQNQKFGLVSPMKFIPLAEETGLIHKIGKWVLYAACHQGKLWIDQGIDIDSIAINISGAQIKQGKLVEEVTEALNDSRLPPERLELEVTEGFILDDPDAAIKQLSTLRDIGVVISIDDFGTGYSSLSYLKRLPIQKLKIDQSFVRDIPNNTDDMAIADAVIAMGHSLDLSVIAEGVETEEQAEFLTSHGCNKAQGFLFSKPVTAEELETLLLKKSHQ
jgi:diguanylate cyclase (GGDEF)-like protein/PAS domain S-box-containing protein